MGHLWCDILDLDSHLLKNTPFSLQLEKSSSPTRYIDAEPIEGTIISYDFFIDDMYILVDMALPSAELSSTIERRLETSPARYNFEHLSLKKFIVPQANYTYNFSRVWSGVLPRRFAFSFQAQLVYQGSYFLDSTKLSLDNIKSLNLKVNERDLISVDLHNSMVPNFERMIQFLQTGAEANVSIMSYKFSAGYICVDLNTLCQNNESCISEIHPSGTLSLELEFEKVTPTAWMCFMYSFCDGSLEVTKDRNANIRTVIA